MLGALQILSIWILTILKKDIYIPLYRLKNPQLTDVEYYVQGHTSRKMEFEPMSL